MCVFPRVHPDWSQALRWGVSLVAAMLFFASILAHELAHAVVAISRGLGVESITLFLFGGVATIEREPDSAKDEFVIAIAGPVMSLLLGGAFLLVAALTGGIARISGGSLGQTLAQLSPISTMMLWLGPINVILAVFNMVPGFPLDGGRVLRSVLWALTRRYRRATQWASTVGQAIGWIFVFAGLGMVLGLQLPFLGSGVLNGLWLGFIGWFLRNAAVQSQQQALVNEMLTNVPVSSLMQQNVRAVPADLRVSQLVSDFVNGGEERCFPVVENGLVAGMVCVDDIRKVKRQEWYGTSVRAIMTGNNAQNTLRPG
jgi:Zn-dependent protease